MAGLDTSIYGQIQPAAAPVNPLMQLGQIAQLRNYQTQADAQQRAMQTQDRRNAVLASPEFQSADTNTRQNLLYSAGDVEGATKVGTASAAANKDTREAQKTQLEMHLKTLEAAANIAGTVTDQASYDRALPMMQSLGFDTSKFSPQYNPDGVRQFAQATLTQKDRLDAAYKQASLGETVRHNTATEGIQTGQLGVAQEGNQIRRDANAVAAGNGARAAQGKVMDTEMKLADDYRNQSKDFKAVADAYRTIQTTLDKATTSPAATLAGATKFMKLLDPGSVVRESELGMALAASGVIDRALNYVNVLQSGKVLTPTQVKDFKGITDQIYTAAKEGQAQVDADYTDKANRYGLDPKNIIQDLGPKQTSTTAKKPAAPTMDLSALEAEMKRRGLK